MRNERVFIVVLSYIIGFTTAFIGFALTKSSDYKDHHHDKDHMHSHNKRHSAKADYDSTTTSNRSVEVVFDEAGMYAVVGEERVIVSGMLSDVVEPGPGFHVDVPFYSVSPSGNYVYYCEQQTQEAEDCSYYMYLIDEHVIKPLKLNGENLSSVVAQSGFEWTEQEELTAPGYRSTSSATPWQLAATTEE
ncbi:hypothetical protein N9L26_00075 [Candidatus Pacebacteria bacterium]|nr:hypothetical protein [Candidatus Paceibacterota bacterium]